jgi:hypothetical protein
MKMIAILILSLLTSVLTAPPNKSAVIIVPEVIKPYEAIWNATCKVESDFNPLAYNPSEGAIGIVQIRGIRLRDYVKRTGKYYILKDCYDKKTSKEIWLYYAMKFHHGDYESIAKAWNASRTNKYWDKVKSQL